MKVITVGNTKGGVGKSTLACNLAVCATNEGKNVLLVDSDPQGSSIGFCSVREDDDAGLLKITGVAIPNNKIHKNISSFKEFDYVIIDSGGRDSSIFRSAMLAAANGGLLVIPVLPSQYDIWATEDTIDILREARVYVEIKAMAIYNQVLQSSTIADEAEEAMMQLVRDDDIYLATHKLGNRVDVKKSVSYGKGIIEYRPKSKASEEMLAIWEEIKSQLQ